MEFKHTPAPWIIIDGDDYFNITAKSTESSPNYMPLLDSDSIGMIEMRANAHLIAAAPELLALLMKLDRIGGLGLSTHKEIQSVIAKALGQQ